MINIRILSQDGCGPVNPKGFKDVCKKRVSGLRVGDGYASGGARGENFAVRVREVKESTVVLDIIYPAAGEPVNFKVRVVGVEPGVQFRKGL